MTRSSANLNNLKVVSHCWMLTLGSIEEEPLMSKDGPPDKLLKLAINGPLVQL